MVEIKETPKIVIAKPVACRPSLSKPFSEFVSGAVTASSTPSAVCEAAVAIVRPRTLRFNPTANVSLVGDVDCRSSEKAPETKMGSNVVYRPVAKVVSKRTLSLLANLGSGRGIILRQDIADAGTSFPPSNQDKPQTNPSTNFHHDIPLESKTGNAALKNAKDDTKSLPLPHVGDQSSYNGHTWRKYGQKQVKGSEYPRSYYKCTHPHCPVKKKVEKTLDGQIAEIVYNGEHNHSKYHATLDGNARVEDPVISAPRNASVSTSNNSVSGSVEASESLEVEGDEFKSKQMKNDNQNLKGSALGEASSKPRTESDTVEDRFRWRKYGQKVVKGNPYPRSYYKCTSPKCNARKYVERTSEDPDSFITTYEGRHNHGIPPVKTIHSEASKKTCRNKS